jgi:HPt (histidine-containing phosphotransfer) domain-containing protein
MESSGDLLRVEAELRRLRRRMETLEAERRRLRGETAPDTVKHGEAEGEAALIEGMDFVTFDLNRAFDSAAEDADQLERLMELVVAEIPAQIAKLRAALAGGDMEAAGRHAHTAKGQAAYIGAETFRELAYAAELAAKDGDGAKAESLLPGLEARFAAIQEEIGRIDWPALRDALNG